MFRSVGAILAGFVTSAVLALGADAVLRATVPQAMGEPVTSVPILLGTAVYTFVFGGLGAWLTARLAPTRPLFHALVLGTIALVLSVAATVQFWSTAPPWYHAAVLAQVLPAAWLGGTLRLHQVGGRLAAPGR